MKREVLERIRDLRRRGWSFAGIAKQVGVPQSDVVKALGAMPITGPIPRADGQGRVSRG